MKVKTESVQSLLDKFKNKTITKEEKIILKNKLEELIKIKMKRNHVWDALYIRGILRRLK